MYGNNIFRNSHKSNENFKHLIFFCSKMDCENLEPVKGLVKKPTKLNEALLKAKPLFNPGK